MRIQQLWLLAYGRPISDEEQEKTLHFLGTDDFNWIQLCHALLASNEFLMRL